MAIQKIPNTLIADNAVTAAKIANGSLTADDISNNSITAAKLSVSTSPTFADLTTTGTINGLTLAAGSVATSTAQNFAINTPNSLRINIDSNNSNAGEIFAIGHNQTGVDASNNVLFLIQAVNARAGFNATSLNADLHIGSSNAVGDATNPAFQIGGASTYRLGMYTSSEGAVIENKNGDDGIQFKVKTAGEAMRIDGGTGNVGINETSPDYKLHISGSGSAAQMQIESTSNANAQLIFRNTASAGSGATGGFHIGLLGDTSGDGLIYHHHDKPIRFYTNAANTMTLTGENGMLHLNGRSGAYGYAVPQDESLGYTNNLNAGAFGILHRGSYDSYITGNTYYYRTGGASSWRAKYGAFKSTVIGMVNGAVNFDCSTTAPGTDGAAVSGLATRVKIDSDGLKFGSDTASANALDDYEEGTWTPSYQDASGNAITNQTSQQGSYVKVGSLVYIQGSLRTQSSSSTSGLSGSLKIAGLPFTSANVLSNGHVVFHTHETSSSYNAPAELPRASSVGSNSTKINLYKYSGSGGRTTLFQVSDLTMSGNSNFMFFAGTYRID